MSRARSTDTSPRTDSSRFPPHRWRPAARDAPRRGVPDLLADPARPTGWQPAGRRWSSATRMLGQRRALRKQHLLRPVSDARNVAVLAREEALNPPSHATSAPEPAKLLHESGVNEVVETPERQIPDVFFRIHHWSVSGHPNGHMRVVVPHLDFE